jgi:hypothetical protein
MIFGRCGGLALRHAVGINLPVKLYKYLLIISIPGGFFRGFRAVNIYRPDFAVFYCVPDSGGPAAQEGGSKGGDGEKDNNGLFHGFKLLSIITFQNDSAALQPG